jgi:hypothetical protein
MALFCSYYPSVFILKPGQCVHINKGRLHAFRKLTFDNLPEEDCHSSLRNTLVKKLTEENKVMVKPCVSVAWDWFYIGITRHGIEKEVTHAMTMADLNQQRPSPSLGIPGRSILSKALAVLESLNDSKLPLFDFKTNNDMSERELQPNLKMVIQGIETSLTKIMEFQKSMHLKILEKSKEKKIDIMDQTDAYYIIQTVGSIDPYGNDFVCKFCYTELYNLYLHCNGCDYFGADFNICFR